MPSIPFSRLRVSLPSTTSVLATVLLGACGGEASRTPPFHGTGAGGSSGLEELLYQEEEAAPAQVLVSPKGRHIVPGMVDEGGWTLPLDIRRPRPPRSLPPRQTREEILKARRSVTAGAFPETRLGPDDGHTQNETSIDAQGPVLVAGWNNFTDSGLVMGAGRSANGGDTWTFELFGGHTTMSDPAVSAGGGSKWYFGYLALGGVGGNDAEIYIRRSLDGGATWQAPVAVTDNGTFDDKPYIDSRDDEVLVAWADFSFSPSKVRAARSLDGGQTFDEDTILAVNSVAGNAASPVISNDGTYYVFWRDSFQEFLWMSRSSDQGESWTGDATVAEMSPLPATLPGGFRALNAPVAAAHPATGDLLVVWNDQLFGDPDILAVRSSDGGAVWGAPVRVNDDPAGSGQYFPWLVFDDTGTAHAIWYDRRQNGSDLDVYLASSGDGGATWGANRRITAQSFTPVLPAEGGAASFIGDYNGLAASGGALYPFYQDAREGNQDVYVAVVSLQEGVFEDGFESGDTSAWSSSTGSP